MDDSIPDESRVDYEIQELSLSPTDVIAWFLQVKEMPNISPGEATGTDTWGIVTDTDEIIGLAIVGTRTQTDADLLGIAVRSSYQRFGLGTALVDRITANYGSLRTQFPVSHSVNNFFEATGWQRHGVISKTPEDLIEWRYPASSTPDE